MDVIDRPVIDITDAELEKLQNEAYEKVDQLLKEIRDYKAEIRSREEAIVTLCKKYKISAILD
ncbi:MAG: hypothetical protein SVM80_01165 [Halobacteriota archaeon]|nr:hypothetical protein [Halobacteriota archaeon]